MNEHRACFGDAFLKNLAVLRFFVIEERIHVDRLIVLAHARINPHLAEQRLHAEGASLVGDNGHNELAQLRIAQQFRQQPHEDHGR